MKSKIYSSNFNIDNSVIAGNKIKNAVNINNSDIDVISFARKIKKTAFWISLLTGIISSLMATIIFEYIKGH